MDKIGVVLSGGGARGSFQVGALEVVIKEIGLNPSHFFGVSVGALNSAMLSQANPSHDDLLKYLDVLKGVWLGIKENKDIYDYSFIPILNELSIIFSPSLFKPNGLKKIIQTNIDKERLFSSLRFFSCGVVDFVTGEYSEINNRDKSFMAHIDDYILASASMPTFFPPVNIDGKLLFDGGLRNITPLASVFKHDLDKIIVIYASPFDVSKSDASSLKIGKDYLLRTIDVLTNEIYRNDTELAKKINLIVKLLKGTSVVNDLQEVVSYFSKYKYVEIVEVIPKRQVIENVLEFDHKKIEENIEEGKKVAREVFSLIL